METGKQEPEAAGAASQQPSASNSAAHSVPPITIVNNIPPQQAAPVGMPVKSEGSSTLFIFVIILLALVVGGGVVYFLTPKYPAPAVTETAAPSELVSPPAQDAVRTVSIGPNGIAASGYDVNDVQQLAGIQQGMKWDAACGCQKPVAAPPPPVVVPKPHPRPKPKATCDDACKEYQRLKGVSVDVSKSCSYVLVRNPQPVVLKTAWGKVVTSWAQSQISWQQTSRGWLGQICAPASVYATAGPGARYCAEIAQSEMNEDERSRLMAGGTWDSNDPFCLKSQAECRADNLSWK